MNRSKRAIADLGDSNDAKRVLLSVTPTQSVSDRCRPFVIRTVKHRVVKRGVALFESICADELDRQRRWQALWEIFARDVASGLCLDGAPEQFWRAVRHVHAADATHRAERGLS